MSEREWTDMTPKFKVRVFQWNVLADSCATDDPQGFPYVPKEALDTEMRRPMQIKEILADDADVIALEEVDNPYDFEEALKENGYKVLYNRREDSQLGVLTAYKEAKYKLEAKAMITFAEGGQVATIIRLKEVALGREFVFAAAHLKAKDDNKSQMTRILQSEELLKHTKNISDDGARAFVDWKMRGTELNIILAGDLNDGVDSCTVRPWTHLDGFQLAYEACDKTTFKVRTAEGGGKTTKCCTEDYIIHNGATVRVRTLPEAFVDPFLPSKTFPSDHLSLCAEIVFVN